MAFLDKYTLTTDEMRILYVILIHCYLALYHVVVKVMNNSRE